jgi:hypothetical protein
MKKFIHKKHSAHVPNTIAFFFYFTLSFPYLQHVHTDAIFSFCDRLGQVVGGTTAEEGDMDASGKW